MKWVDEVRDLVGDKDNIMCIDGKTVLIHKTLNPKILAHSAIKVTEVEFGFIVQTSIVVRI